MKRKMRGRRMLPQWVILWTHWLTLEKCNGCFCHIYFCEFCLFD